MIMGVLSNIVTDDKALKVEGKVGKIKSWVHECGEGSMF